MNGQNARFDFTAPAVPLEDLGAVHFIAIGGAGMSGVARVMLARGCVVSGSDAKESPVLQALASEGADVHVGHDPAYLEGKDTVVISSAIRDTNVELAAARAGGLRVLHRSQALASTMARSRRVAVAGANGKTTTTSMLTVALQHCGIDPSFAAGGELAKHGTNAHWGTGDVFVAEADESDGSFLVYRPEVAIVKTVQPDHLDFYGTSTTSGRRMPSSPPPSWTAASSWRATTTRAPSRSRRPSGRRGGGCSPTGSRRRPTSSSGSR
jgi:UDP-N-acetylmuramate--alanine ligase